MMCCGDRLPDIVIASKAISKLTFADIHEAAFGSQVHSVEQDGESLRD